MRFLNPKTDFAFKRIFGSSESGDILISFLNAILTLESPHRMSEVEILDPYLAPKIKGMKDTYLDVRAKDESGKSYIIEMQVLNVEGFEQRVLYNACKSYAGQLESGEGYQNLTDVIAITITDFVMFKELNDVVNSFKLRAENGHVYHDDLELIFAELPKFNKHEDELKSDLDRWFYFLKSAASLEAVPKSMADDAAIQHAFRIANKAGLSREELDDQEHREIFIQDQRGALSLAKRQGLEEGMEKGREEGLKVGLEKGREEGAFQAKEKIACSLLNTLDNQVIAGATGLSAAHIQTLRLKNSKH
ncbi:MAG: Rpn family recombination-promoting nuclease/putative transposase [Zetaproteobacteria bacterium]|nr:Rpn family recombination-promoting nuclease/putative transposase [Zetaproteobacteria bacterium]